MTYTVFLYKTTAVCASALAIETVNRAIAHNSKRDWAGNCADQFMAPFPAGAVKGELEAATVSEERTSLCKAVILRTPQNKVEYLCVVTSYEVVKTVLAQTHRLAIEHGLVLYDAELQRGFFPGGAFDAPYVAMKLRAKQINKMLADTQKPLWHIRRLETVRGECDKSCSYVVTLCKDGQKSLEKRTQQFYEGLKRCLLDDERLILDHKCFTVAHERYEITYCVEGYKKHANRVGYIRDGKACTALLHRMSTEQAIRWCKEQKEGLDDVNARMRFSEMLRAYPNPADRFVASVNIQKQQRKETFDVEYGAIGCYGSQILFHVVVDEWRDSKSISVLKIEETSASFLLPMIDEVYPFFLEKRYYVTENHIAAEAMVEITNRIRSVKEMVLHDTMNEALKPYITYFNLFVLARRGEPYEEADCECIRKDPVQFVYLHRYEIARLYDLFIAWVDAQLKTYGEDDGLMFNIQGP